MPRHNLYELETLHMRSVRELCTTQPVDDVDVLIRHSKLIVRNAWIHCAGIVNDRKKKHALWAAIVTATAAGSATHFHPVAVLAVIGFVYAVVNTYQAKKAAAVMSGQISLNGRLSIEKAQGHREIFKLADKQTAIELPRAVAQHMCGSVPQYALEA